jgi:hypothetical protein
MLNNRHANRILKAANAVYPDGFIDRIRKGDTEAGDGLAAFLVEEIRESAENGTTPREITGNVIKALETAEREFHRVINALREIKHRPVKKAKGLKNFTVYWTLKGRKVYKARTEEEAGEIHNMDSLACESEVCEDVYIEEGGED